ncbi:glycosyltransferase [Rubrobacter indicoceani]|uniref:glycosyltransferase n=1 Tax=Rubrobacter indicoceani TaxID=2051957 RepID=UPI0013C4C070|nr:glycosyltransferase [Rubrobacter indicoceani]
MTDGGTGEKRLRLLQVIEATGAGVGRHVRTLSEGLSELRHEVVVVYAPERLDPAFREFVGGDSARFVKVNMGREVSPLSDLKSLRKILRVIRDRGPFDVVHGHSSKGGALGRAAALVSRIPAVYTPHSMIVSSPGISRKKAAAYTAVERVLGYGATGRIIAVSEDEAEFFRKIRAVPKKRIRVVPNALRDKDFRRFEERDPEETKNGGGGGPITFGSTMRFSEQKAPENLLEAFYRLKRSRPAGLRPVRLRVAGDGELLSGCLRRVGELGLEGDVEFPGWVSDPGEFLGGLDVFVVSSHYEAGVSYSTMEAMAAGLPVVTTRVFGAGVVEGAEGNRVVPTGDAGALSGAMAAMLGPGGEGEELRRIGERNHAYARETFDQRLATRRTEAVYRELAKDSS